jgi:hypothetical protein
MSCKYYEQWGVDVVTYIPCCDGIISTDVVLKLFSHNLEIRITSLITNSRFQFNSVQKTIMIGI